MIKVDLLTCEPETIQLALYPIYKEWRNVRNRKFFPEKIRNVNRVLYFVSKYSICVPSDLYWQNNNRQRVQM